MFKKCMVGLVLGWLASVASAEIILSSLDSSSNAYYNIESSQWTAFRFETGESPSTLRSVWYGCTGTDTTNPVLDSFSVSLYSDNAGTPGSELEVYPYFQGLREEGSTHRMDPLPCGDATSEYDLASNTSYWLIAANTDSSDHVQIGVARTGYIAISGMPGYTFPTGYNFYTSADQGDSWDLFNSQQYYGYAGLSTETLTIPEPATLALLIAGGLMLKRTRKGRKNSL